MNAQKDHLTFKRPRNKYLAPTDYKPPDINVASVPFLSLASAVVMHQGQAAEAAKKSGQLLHIILGSGHCGGVGAQRSEIIE